MPERDRYISFNGLDCDGNARCLMEYLNHNIDAAGAANQWTHYFALKLRQRVSMGQDELFFIGSQINSLRSFFEEMGDEDALTLLDQVEEECC